MKYFLNLNILYFVLFFFLRKKHGDDFKNIDTVSNIGLNVPLPVARTNLTFVAINSFILIKYFPSNEK